MKVKAAGRTLYLDVGYREDGTAAEIFLDIGKEGTVLRDLLHGFAISVSVALQWGVPLDALLEQFEGSEFSTGEGNVVLDAIFTALRPLAVLPKEPCTGDPNYGYCPNPEDGHSKGDDDAGPAPSLALV